MQPTMSWRRFAVAFGLALGVALLLRGVWTSGFPQLLARTTALGLVGLLIFTLFEQRPRRLPRWLARWALQVVGVGVAMPVTTLFIYIVTTKAGAPPRR